MRADLTAPALALAGHYPLPACLPGSPPARRPAPPQRSAGDYLREALKMLGDYHGQVLAHRERAWASVTFAGTRHTLTLLFAGAEAIAAGDRFLAALPDHEFAIPGQLVADAAVTEVDQRLLPSPRLTVECELLLLEEG